MPAPPRNSELDRLGSFFAMERQHDLFAARVGDWSPWRVMRGPVLLAALALPLATVARPIWVRTFEAANATLRFAWLLLVGRSRELIVKTCRSALRRKQGDRYADVYFDGLLESRCSFLKLEEINSPDFGPQARAALIPRHLDPIVFTFWGRILGKLLPLRRAQLFCERLSAILERDLGVALSPSWLRMRVSTVHWQARLYSLLLGRIRARVVLVSDTGEFGLRLACVRGHVPFVELQHGVFDANHPDAVPADIGGSKAELLLPDVLASRGQFWIDELADTRQGRGAVVAVGNELIDEARDKRTARARGGPVHIVVTSQGFDTPKLAAWLAEAVRQAPPQLDWRLSIKLHPIYDAKTDDYDRLAGDSRIAVIAGAASPNVFDLLADADLHLSISSACHFDAVALGVRSAVVPLASHELVLYAVDGDLIHLAARPADTWTLAQLAPPEPEAGYRFSPPGFVPNMEALIAAAVMPNGDPPQGN